MSSAPRLTRGGGGHEWRWLVVLAVLLAGAVVLTAIGRGIGPAVSAPPPTPTAVVRTVDGPIIVAGMGSQTTDPFYLAGGTYRSEWSAWGEAAVFPPCTHSAALMAVDPSNAETSRGHVSDLANLVHVPATGASAASYVYNVAPGDYYLDIDSACGWQIALSRIAE